MLHNQPGFNGYLNKTSGYAFCDSIYLAKLSIFCIFKHTKPFILCAPSAHIPLRDCGSAYLTKLSLRDCDSAYLTK